jgi:hypothetical protein
VFSAFVLSTTAVPKNNQKHFFLSTAAIHIEHKPEAHLEIISLLKWWTFSLNFHLLPLDKWD